MSKKSIEFLTISTDPKILNYGGFCKLKLNALSKQIIVEPDNEDVKPVSAMFDTNFIVEQKFLIAEDPKNLTNFVIIFKSSKIAKKVFKVVAKNMDANIGNEKWFDNKFWPLFSNSSDINIKKIGERYMKLCEQSKKNQAKRTQKIDVENQKNGNNLNQRLALKRKIDHRSAGRRVGKKNPKQSDYARKVQCTNYKLFTYKHKERLRKKLFIFDVKEDSELCHKYLWNDKDQIFKCWVCVSDSKKHISTATIHKTNNGKDYVEFGFHGCKAYKYDPGRLKEKRKIIYKPDYKIIKGIIDDEERQRLFIFDPTNKELCYVYSFTSNSQAFECLGCQKYRKSIKAKIFFENTENEYLEVYTEDHVCKLQPYYPEKIFRTFKELHLPDFEIRNVFFHGKEVQRLIVFDLNDRKYCYEYHHMKPIFKCRKCLKMGKYVYAKYNPLENVVRLGLNPHICERQIYVPEELRKEIIFESSKFKIIPSTRNIRKQIIIFHETDKNMCYNLTKSRNMEQYHCGRCKAKNGTYVVNLCKNDDDDESYYLTMKPNQKHLCSPKKLKDFDLKPKLEIVKTSNFIFYENSLGAKRMAIFTTSEKKFCYDYYIEPTGKTFLCRKCKKCETTSNFYQSQNGEEDFFQYMPSKHTCKPVRYGIIKSKIVKYLKPSECIPAKKVEEKIITKITNFELRTDKDYVKDAILILFHPTDKTLCYHYKYYISKEKYLCCSCLKKGARVYAILQNELDGQKYIIQGQKNHVCDAIKYESEKEIEKFTNFIHLKKTKKNVVEKLIVFTSDAKSDCYVYRKEKNRFRCIRCTPTKYVMANLLTDECGINFVEFGKQQHICIPQEYTPEKFSECKQLSQNEFELFPNTKGTPDSRIIILNSVDQNLGYEYKFTDKFNCSQCLLVAKKRIMAKLITNENGEKYLELSNNEHLCQKLNFNKLGRIFYSNEYEIENGKENQTIAVKHPKDKKLYYKFKYDNDLKIFHCVGCQKKKKFISAKICKKSNETEFLLLAFDHVCVPLKM